MANINNILAASTSTAKSSRGLNGTQRLTELASRLASNFIEEVATSDVSDEELLDAIKSNDKLDSLIRELIDVEPAYDDVDYFLSLGDDFATKALKSQQSKRSRLKNKTLTSDTFYGITTAACAEITLRDIFGLAKHAGGAGARRGSVSYTDDELDELAADQEALKKALRNVQSKKSIMKSKAGFDPESAAWLELLEAEEQLKSRREKTTRTRTVKVDETKAALSELLSSADTAKMSKQQLMELIASVQGLTTEE
jgi:DNA-binding transcriptional regulator YhcF (GntR family)